MTVRHVRKKAPNIAAIAVNAALAAGTVSAFPCQTRLINCEIRNKPAHKSASKNIAPNTVTGAVTISGADRMWMKFQPLPE
jgi:hypothetical protein